MNRPIEFRGMDLSGNWKFGNLFIDKCNCLEPHYFIFTDDVYSLQNNKDCFVPFEVIPETVGQFTGLYDKNGKKIFEGDKVEYFGRIYSIKFGDCYTNLGEYSAYGYYLNNGYKRLLVHGKFVKVIGTIHDKEN